MHNSDFFNELIKRSTAEINSVDFGKAQDVLDPDLIQAISLYIIAISTRVIQNYEQMLDEEAFGLSRPE